MDDIDELKLNTTLPVVIASEEGFIEYINSPFESVFGWTAKEIIGKPLTTIIPKHLHDAHYLGFSRFLHTGQPTLLNKALQLPAVKKNGEIFLAEHIIYACKKNGSWKFGATVSPILLGEKSES